MRERTFAIDGLEEEGTATVSFLTGETTTEVVLNRSEIADLMSVADGADSLRLEVTIKPGRGAA